MADANVVACPAYEAPAKSGRDELSLQSSILGRDHKQYAKNFNPVGLLHTRIQIAATVQQKHMYTSTGHLARV
jgi:hypothetical protein